MKDYRDENGGFPNFKRFHNIWLYIAEDKGGAEKALGP